ncbi:sulfate ABC transporter ATP-binding protein [Mangrovactinospora gilvigrisea]|uniref:Sulfate ABC transporter ATP-binding protein n=1 Tax=Mangrovactinospora gilvigrisea TaxID=1428644 RepID=A0A1J7BV38_9ACTN|nr:ABC transporter ATP-binding protein [Mangrovactinospora gilvigrisea]OIV37345.1 sulfate ABC transporter ATP-binding protein [Mangrovactinospora gilvigrisea]
MTANGKTTGVSVGAEIGRFEDVRKDYGSVTAVDGVSFTLRAGETVAFLGPNGAGKSTSLDMLLGLREPSSGRVSLFDGSPRDAIASGRVGAMLQSGGLMEDVTVRELIRLSCDLHPHRRPVDEVLADAGLTEIADRRSDKLSGGQAQRLRFGMAIAGRSDLIVLDEPTVGMDVSARQAFWKSMRTIADSGRTVLFATHYLEEADNVADRVLVVNRGRLIADGTAAEIKDRAGARHVSFDLEELPARSLLEQLPALVSLEVHGRTVRMRTSDADATVAAVYGAGLYPRGLEVTSVGLEQAFLTLTADDENHTQRNDEQGALR